MKLIRINDVVESYGLSSRTLRYYEKVGILWSTHPENKAQRYYDNAALERLNQIIVLRKLQIPIKDIVSIYKSNNTASLIKAFVAKLESLDEEITSLSELRQIVNDFLQKMILTGIKKISTITLLYKETERQIAPASKNRPVTLKQLSDISRETLRLHDVRIIRLPAMHVLTSRMKSGETIDLDGDNMQQLFAEYGIKPVPGLRNSFFIRKSNNEWIMAAKVADDFINITPYIDSFFDEGMYAVASSFMEDMDETFVLLREFIIKSENFEPDIGKNGELNRDEMIEEVLPWDIAQKLNRYQQDIFLPIRTKQ